MISAEMRARPRQGLVIAADSYNLLWVARCAGLLRGFIHNTFCKIQGGGVHEQGDRQIYEQRHRDKKRKETERRIQRLRHADILERVG